jgi:acyl dehydratase
MVLLARQLYFEAVKVGDELPPLVKPPLDRAQIARYCGATGEYGPLHVDEPFARSAGFPSVLVPGMLAMGFLGELALDWLRGARLRRFGSRFVKIVWPGDVLTARGRVVDRRFEAAGRYAVDIELWAENQRGELVVRGAVTAQLYYSAEDEARQRAGQPPLLVTPAEEEERLARLSRSSAPSRPSPTAARPTPVRAPPPPRPVSPGSRAPEKKPAVPAPRAPARPAVVPRPTTKPKPKPKLAVKPKPKPTVKPKPAAKARSGARPRPARGKGPKRR